MNKNGTTKRNKLNTRQARFVRAKTMGHNNTESAIMAGYSKRSAGVTGSKLLRNTKIIKALEDNGLTDSVLAKTIKTNIERGTGIKADANTATKNVELALKLKGYMNTEQQKPTNLSQTNIYIEEMNKMDNNMLTEELRSLQGELKQLQENSK